MSKNATLEIITIGQIDVSKTNPRKSFDEKGLKELTQSIKEHGILQPILVRPKLDIEADMEHFELVCGERRYRAAILAGLEEIPVNVRVLTDDEAFELQIVENLERKDVHPLDEADAFKKMLDSGKYTIADIAAKMAKTESFIAQRLKLVDLIDEIRQDFIAGYLGIGHAILIARCDAIKQMDIYNDAKPWKGSDDDPDYGTVSEVRDSIESDSYLISKAKFDTEDADLIKGCVACSVCPKRSGVNPVLFEDMQEDRCFDEKCFDSKEEAHIEKQISKIINNAENVIIVNGWGNPSDMVIEMCKQFNVRIYQRHEWLLSVDDTIPNDVWNPELIKAFCPNGEFKGSFANVFLKKDVSNNETDVDAHSSIGSNAPISNEVRELKEAISKIESRADRAKELDGEKVWAQIRAIDTSEIKTIIGRLFPVEVNALCLAMISKLGYYGNNEVKKLVGDFNLKTIQERDFTKFEYNQISRIFFWETLPSSYGDYYSNVNNYAYTKALMHYESDKINGIIANQKAISDVRMDKADAKIKELKAKIENLKSIKEERKCRECGCTENDCSQCIEKTGFACSWIEADLCSACQEPAEVEFEDTDPAVENPNLFEKVTKKYALNNSYFKNRHPKSPANPLEVAQYFKQFGELPFDMDANDNPDWLYDTYIEYQKRNNVYHSQFFTPPATAIQMAGVAHQYFDNSCIVLDACSGFGALSKPLVQDGFKVVAFDFSKEMVDLYNMNYKFENQDACEQLNFMEGEFDKKYYNIISNPPYEGPALTKFLECVHENLIDGGTAVLLIPRGFVDKDKPKALVSILDKFIVTHREDMQEDFARTGIKAEIVVLEKA